MSESARRRATLAEMLAIPEAMRFHELVGGELIEEATPSGEHGVAQAGVVSAVGPSFQRTRGRGGPGGWWIAVGTLFGDDPPDAA